MADKEVVVGKTVDGRLLVFFEQSGTSSYSSGGFDITIGSLKEIETVVYVGNNYGYRTEAAEAQERISNNKFTLPVHYYGYACPSAPACVTGWEVSSGTDLSHVTFYGLVIGI